MSSRRCCRPACKEPAVYSLTYVYRDSTAVLGPLASFVEPHCYDLCSNHADRLTAPDELLDSALELGGEIAANPRPQLRMIKLLLTENAVETDLRMVQEREHRLIRECWRSSEHRRAVEAFLAKRG